MMNARVQIRAHKVIDGGDFLFAAIETDDVSLTRVPWNARQRKLRELHEELVRERFERKFPHAGAPDEIRFMTYQVEGETQ